MNNEQAKKILALYRPGTPDRLDPSFNEALDLASPQPSQVRWEDRPNAELGQWFQEHRASYLSVRAKFLMVPAPPLLKDRILAECKTHKPIVVRFRPMVFLRAAAVLVLCLGLAALFWPSHAREDDFNTYRTRMTRTALQLYGMGLETNDLQSINAYFNEHKAPADYVLPGGMSKAQLVGCAVLKWQGQPVSMVCFQSGRPLAAGQKSDLWLFVIDQSLVRNGPLPVHP